MGTGKSTLARALAPGLGPAPGARVVRSDEIRKRLHGVAHEVRLPAEAYGPAANARTDAALLDAVREAAAAGRAVIADATFMDADLRAAVARAAGGLSFLGVWLDAPLAELERRVAARRGDASDATVTVLRRAAARVRPPTGWARVDAVDAARAEAQVQSLLSVL